MDRVRPWLRLSEVLISPNLAGALPRPARRRLLRDRGGDQKRRRPVRGTGDLARQLDRPRRRRGRDAVFAARLCARSRLGRPLVDDRGDEDFFRVTKRVHNHLHGADGDGGELGPRRGRSTRGRWRRTPTISDPGSAPRTSSISRPADGRVDRGDGLRSAGHVIWRCHVGLDTPNARARAAWGFLHRYVEQADAYVFSRRLRLGRARRRQALARSAAVDLARSRPRTRTCRPGPCGRSSRGSGSPATVGPPAACSCARTAPIGAHLRGRRAGPGRPGPRRRPPDRADSRWDRLKDPAGVLSAFAERCRHPAARTCCSPGLRSPRSPTIPKGPRCWPRSAPNAAALQPTRARVHLASLPMDDGWRRTRRW